jgi:hypothetical protein
MILNAPSQLYLHAHCTCNGEKLGIWQVLCYVSCIMPQSKQQNSSCYNTTVWALQLAILRSYTGLKSEYIMEHHTNYVIHESCHTWWKGLGHAFLLKFSNRTYLQLLWVQDESVAPNCETSQSDAAPGCSTPDVVSEDPQQAAALDATLPQEPLSYLLTLSQEWEIQQAAAEILAVKPVVSGAELPAPVPTLHSLPLSPPISVNTCDIPIYIHMQGLLLRTAVCALQLPSEGKTFTENIGPMWSWRWRSLCTKKFLDLYPSPSIDMWLFNEGHNVWICNDRNRWIILIYILRK